MAQQADCGRQHRLFSHNCRRQPMIFRELKGLFIPSKLGAYEMTSQEDPLP